jgi:hypothetical protein
MSRADRHRRLIPDWRAMGYEVFPLHVRGAEAPSRRRVLERDRAMGRDGSRAAMARSFATGPATFESLSARADGCLQIDGRTGGVLQRDGRPFPSEPALSRPAAPSP